MGLKGTSHSAQGFWAITRWNQTKMGLKDCGCELCLSGLHKVEIRPRWDWKVITAFTDKLVKLLKSDQDGIERQMLMEAIYTLGEVEIRPRWDWKETGRYGVKILAKSWNQTKMGLKDLVSFHVFCSRNVEIRPRWDWKFQLICIVYSYICWNQTKMGLKAFLG